MNNFILRAVVIGAASVAAIVGAGMVLPPASNAAEPSSLEGAWSGGGTVKFPSGESERARCRASFRKRGGSTFAMSAVCATPSARIEQTAQLERTGANHFSGDFQNAEYNISGSIKVTVHGNSLFASMSGGGGSAHFNLGR